MGLWIKICANTNLDDASLAAELGADAVGFVFASSKRQVTPDQVAAIVPKLSVNVEKIGVFTSQHGEEIVRIVRETGLTGVQLHGGVDVDLARGLRHELGTGVTIIQTLHWEVDADRGSANEIAAHLRTVAAELAIDRVLVDSKIGAVSGGSGIGFDWSEARDTLAGCTIDLIVAGGLRSENVAAAVATLAPWGVDVASGVEAVAGLKDSGKLRRFIKNARGPTL